MSTNPDSSEALLIKRGVWKISGASNCYLLKDELILIDCGDRKDRQAVEDNVGRIIGLDKVKMILFTHLHYDHIANWDLFTNATLFASKEEIGCAIKNPFGAILDFELSRLFPVNLIKEFPDIKRLKIISTPGHTQGSVCFYMEEGDILFSGDTVFGEGMVGRTDLETSQPEKMQETLIKIRQYDNSILCPGHDY